MNKLIILVALLPPFVLARKSTDFHVDVITGSYNERVRNDKGRLILTKRKYMGIHPCAMDSVCDCWLENKTFNLTINCARRNLVEPPKMYKDLPIYELDLSGNALQRHPNMMDEGYNSVRRLNLSGNRIKNVTADLISDNIEVLSLKNNQISRIDEAFLDKIRNRPNNKWLNLDNNPLTCDCETVAYVNTIHISTIYKLMYHACAGTDKRTKHLIAKEMCPDQIANLLKGFKRFKE